MDEKDFATQQYIALREEIMQRQERRFRVLVAGVFGIPAIALLGRYVEKAEDIGEVFFLIAPIIILVSCFVYLSENNGIIRVGRYIRKEIEPAYPNVVGWETWLEANTAEGSRSVDQYLNLCVLTIAVLYYIGAIVIFVRYADPLIGYQAINWVMVAIYVILGIVFLYVVFRRARYSTRESGSAVKAPVSGAEAGS